MHNIDIFKNSRFEMHLLSWTSCGDYFSLSKRERSLNISVLCQSDIIQRKARQIYYTTLLSTNPTISTKSYNITQYVSPSSQALERKQGKYHYESWPMPWSVAAQEKKCQWLIMLIYKSKCQFELRYFFRISKLSFHRAAIESRLEKWKQRILAKQLAKQNSSKKVN